MRSQQLTTGRTESSGTFISAQDETKRRDEIGARKDRTSENVSSEQAVSDGV